jgi:hypothetical protein
MLLIDEAPCQCLSSTLYVITDQQMIPSGFSWNERHRAIESCVNGTPTNTGTCAQHAELVT